MIDFIIAVWWRQKFFAIRETLTVSDNRRCDPSDYEFTSLVTLFERQTTRGHTQHISSE